MTEVRLTTSLRRVSTGWAWEVRDFFGSLVFSGRAHTRVEAYRDAIAKRRAENKRRKQANREEEKRKSASGYRRFNWGHPALHPKNSY